MLCACTHDFWLLTSKMTIGKCCLSKCLWKFQTCSCWKKLLFTHNEMKWNEKTVLQISNLFKVTSMSIQRFVKKYKHIFQYNIDAWSYYFSFYNTSLVNITVDLHANKKSNNLLGPSNKNCRPKQKTRCAFLWERTALSRFSTLSHEKKEEKKFPH